MSFSTHWINLKNTWSNDIQESVTLARTWFMYSIRNSALETKAALHTHRTMGQTVKLIQGLRVSEYTSSVLFLDL